MMRYMAAVLLLVAVMSARNASSTNKGRHLDISAIAREANGSVVSIVMSDKEGHPAAQGSGFLISKDGRIVTNYHVIRSGASAVIKLPDGAFFAVDGLLSSDKDRDVAIIKAHGNNFRSLTLGDSDRLQIGEEVVAIGSPLSLESTVSNGIISGIRTVEEEGGKFLQITVPISPGSSGGPLFNMAGKVVGITTSHLAGGENLNFAIPINALKPMLLSRFSKVQSLPEEAEGETVSVGPEPIVLFDESQFEHVNGGACELEQIEQKECPFRDRNTGFAEAFATEPSCHGIILLQTSYMARGMWPNPPSWFLDVQWTRLAASVPCSNADVDFVLVDKVTGRRFCSRSYRDGTLQWDFSHFIKNDNPENNKAEEKIDRAPKISSNSIATGVREVCGIVKGVGGTVK